MIKSMRIFLFFFCINSYLYSQLDANSTLGLPRVDNLELANNALGTDNNIIINEAAANIGNLVYNTTDNLIYRYDGTNWLPLTDDQTAVEVPLVTDVDVNGTTTDPAARQILETNVEQAIQAIAPITSKAGRIFYPPSIEIDASAIVNGQTINLYDQYTNQFNTTSGSTIINGVTVNYQTIRSATAPNNIPIYDADELYYYVTFADNTVFNLVSLDDNGLLTYDIVGIPSDFNTIINVVFVVK